MKNLLFLFLITTIKTLYSQDYQIFNEGKLFGIKENDSIVVEAKYDLIYSELDSQNAFHTKKGKLFGRISFRPFEEIEPSSFKEIVYAGDACYESYFYESVYLLIDKKGKPLYSTKNGKYQTKYNPNTLTISKNGDSYFLVGLDSVDSKNKPFPINNAKFLSLKETRLKSTFIAQGLNKKFGLINVVGDTIFPFEYTFIDFLNYDGDGNHHILLGIKDKKVLYQLYTKKFDSHYFDDIRSLESENYTNAFKSIHGNKVGLFCVDVEEQIFENEYDDIFQIRSIDPTNDFRFYKYYVAIKNNKFHVIAHDGDYFKEKSFPLIISEYDLILKDFGYIKNEGKYDKYNLFDRKFVEKVDLNEIVWANKLHKIKYDGNKFGLQDLSGKQLVPFEYDVMGYYSYFKEYVIGFQNSTQYFIEITENKRVSLKEFWEMRNK